MSYQPILISPKNAGLQTNKKPFLLLDNAFQELTNAYVWRERIKKREGIKLVGRLRRVLTAQVFTQTTPASDTMTIANIFTDELGITGESNAQIEPGTLIISIAAPDTSTFTDNGDGTFAVTGIGMAAGSYINYATGAVVLKFSGAAGGGVITGDINYYPGFPVMGIATREIASVNDEITVWFDRKYAYENNGSGFIEVASTSPTTWTGTDSDFFWTTNYRGTSDATRLFFVTNFVNSAANAIRYYNGGTGTWTDFAPLITSTDTLYQARIIIPYYGRLLAFNTYEGTTAGSYGTASNYFNRVRFSQVGNPLAVDAWRYDEFGKGGSIDAPTTEEIISVQLYKNTMIVFFEQSTWQLNYVGEYGTPFLWERISTDYGAESTFSTILFDEGILAVGDKAIISSSSNSVERIDLDIPDTVWGFSNVNQGPERVHGIRNFKKEVVYWSYVSPDLNSSQIFPDAVLIYNYRNNTWAQFRDNVTAFGAFAFQTGVSWNSQTPWDSNVSWNNTDIEKEIAVVSGNQQGFVHWYQSGFDGDNAFSSTVPMIENESLSITNITLSSTLNIRLNIKNHNLINDEVIYVTGMLFIDSTTKAAVDTTLNDAFYLVTYVDVDNIDLNYYNFSVKDYRPTFYGSLTFTPIVGTSTYVGGGYVTLVPNIAIRTKDINPYQYQGKKITINYIDFQTDATPNSSITVNLSIDGSPDIYGNVDIGSNATETTLYKTGYISGATKANPCQITSPGHSLMTGDEIQILHVKGMTNLNGNLYTITFVDLNNFTINTDSTGFNTYTEGGSWVTVETAVSTGTQFYYVPQQKYAWHRFYATTYGQYVSIFLTYDDALMNNLSTHQQVMEINAIQIWTRASGRLP